MIVIAASSTTRTEWVIADGDRIVEHAVTSGLNPFFRTRREISHIIRLELPEYFFQKRWDRIFFYGAGCANPEKIKTIESSLVAQFKTPATVESDLLGAARGLLVAQPGLACILSTGANSCMYDGQNIVQHVRSGGYILGDEGSNSYIGKKLISDIVKGIAPAHLTQGFLSFFNTSLDEVINSVYGAAQPSKLLADYSRFIAEHIQEKYCSKLVYDSFMDFFSRNISFYDYKNNPINLVGSTGCTYREILLNAANDFGVAINKIIPSSIPGLVEYHSHHR